MDQRAEDVILGSNPASLTMILERCRIIVLHLHCKILEFVEAKNNQKLNVLQLVLETILDEDRRIEERRRLTSTAEDSSCRKNRRNIILQAAKNNGK